jgi:hypothetical protein
LRERYVVHAPTVPKIETRCCWLLHCMSPLLAQSRHSAALNQCPLLGVKRTLIEALQCPLLTQSGHHNARLVVRLAWVVATLRRA